MNSKRLIRRAKWIVPMILLLWLVSRVSEDQWTFLKEEPVNVPLLFIALIGAITAMTISFLRWGMLARCQGIPLGSLAACRLGAVGYLFAFVSVGALGGDIVRALVLARRTPGKRVEAFASTIIDRVIGLYALAVLVSTGLTFCLPSSPQLRLEWLHRVSIGISCGGTLALVVLFGSKPLLERSISWSSRLPVVGAAISRILCQFRLFQARPKEVAVALVMSIAAQCVMVMSIYAIACAMYSPFELPGLMEHFVILPVSLLAAALPISPAGLGVFEAALEWMYRVFDASESISGTLVGLMFGLVKIILALIGVAFYWTSEKSDVDQVSAGDSV